MSFFGSIKHVGSNIGKAVAKAGKDTVKAVEKGAKDTEKATVKAAVDTGHVAGAIATSTAGKVILGTALALTGVGAPAAAAIGATVEAGGELTKKGGNLGKALKGGLEGAAIGTAGAVAGSAVSAVKNGTGLGGFASTLIHGRNGTPTDRTATAAAVTAVAAGNPAAHGTDEPAPVSVTQSGVTKTNPPIAEGTPKADSGRARPIPTKGTPVDTHKHSKGFSMESPTAPTPAEIPAAPAAVDAGGGGAAPEASAAPASGGSSNMLLLAAAGIGIVMVIVLASGHKK